MEYRGKKTGMFMGVSRFVIDWQTRYRGIRIVFVWEGSNSWRREKYPIYKARRKTEPIDVEKREEFHSLISHVKDALPSMGVDQVSCETFEADDTVWSVMFADEGRKLFVSTDWDWWPLSMYGDILYGNHVLDYDALVEKFKSKYHCTIPLSRMWLFKALTGDPSDNVSGIPRMPKKIAAEIVSDTGVGEGTVIAAFERHGYGLWAKRVMENMDTFDRNLELVKPSIPSFESLVWIHSDYSEDLFKDFLLKSGMLNLYGRLTGGTCAE